MSPQPAMSGVPGVGTRLLAASSGSPPQAVPRPNCRSRTAQGIASRLPKAGCGGHCPTGSSPRWARNRRHRGGRRTRTFRRSYSRFRRQRRPLPQTPLSQPLPPGLCGANCVVDIPVAAAKDSAAATGAAAIAVAAAPASNSGAMNFSFAIMIMFCHQDRAVQTFDFW